LDDVASAIYARPWMKVREEFIMDSEGKDGRIKELTRIRM
jgi:hypothetical protein